MSNYMEVLIPSIAANFCQQFDVVPSAQLQEKVQLINLSYLNWQIVIDCLPLQLEQLHDMAGEDFSCDTFLDMVNLVFNKQLNVIPDGISVEVCRHYAMSFKHIATINEIVAVH